MNRTGSGYEALPRRSNLTAAFALCILLTGSGSLQAQHCAPITESYLSKIGLTRSAGKLELDLSYSKLGGQTKDAYQAYILMFAESDSAKVAEMTPQAAIESKTALVVETKLIQRNDKYGYDFESKLDTAELVKKMLEAGKLSRDRVDDWGGWMKFKDDLRIAVFIPFLDDPKYSVIDGLPETRHECNYRDDPALLFETLPQKLSVHFGIVDAVRQPEDRYMIHINGRRR